MRYAAGRALAEEVTGSPSGGDQAEGANPSRDHEVANLDNTTYGQEGQGAIRWSTTRPFGTGANGSWTRGPGVYTGEAAYVWLAK